MRIVWKDSKTYKTYVYRGYTIERYCGGWVTNVPGDKNIYYSAEHAHNAIDSMIGGKTRKDASARQSKGIKIIGTK